MKKSGFKPKPTKPLKRTPFKRKKALVASHKPRRAKKRVSKLPKPKIWSLKQADAKFSLYIRERDGVCRFPGCNVTELNKLQCSHYFGRTHKGTRFDPENCISLCWRHHFKDKLLGWEYQKQVKEKQGWDGQYTLYMKKWLGPDGFNQLEKRAGSVKPQHQAIMECMKLCG